MTLLAMLGILVNYSMGFSQLTPADRSAVVSVANNWLHLGQEMGWGWINTGEFSPNSIQDIEYQGELLAFSLPTAGGGYIVVPAYQELPPITAYSTVSFLDVSRENGFCGMLKEVLCYKIHLVRDYLSTPNPPSEAMALQDEITHDQVLWQDYASDYRTFTKTIEVENRHRGLDSERQMEGRYGILAVAPLLGSISWHQYAPYNNFCPWGDGGRCVAGCGAIGMAQIMKYWEYPSNGIGSHSYWWNGDQSCGGSTPGQNLSATLSDSYDWDHILSHYTGSEGSVYKDAVAELCYEVGVSLDMDYGYCGSGSYLSAVTYAFPHYFGYSSSINIQNRSSYTAATWFAMLQAELNYNRPLGYYISDHFIVCDGWQVSGTNQVHMNYGWDDVHNAWYTVDDLYCDWEGCNPMIEKAVRQIIGTPFVYISSPNGGESLYISHPYNITWSGGGFTGNVTISLKRNYPSGSWETLFSGTANDGSENWTVIGPEATNARIRIISDSNPSIGDTSDANFQIVNAVCGSLSDTLGPGIYYVICDISVDAGDSLRLMPGTTFIFNDFYTFEIYGKLLAEGTETDSIVFTTDTLANPDRWHGLRFYNATSSGSQLAFCRIENGLATGTLLNMYGGGVYCSSSSPTFTNCSFIGNSANRYGGGVYCKTSSSSFANCILSDNSADLRGGGLYCDSNSPLTLTNCIFSNNSANDGGGVYCVSSSPNFAQCTFSDNSASGHGGGAACSNSSPIFNSSIIAFSTSEGMYFTSSTTCAVEYGDFYGNSGGNFGNASQGPPGIGVLVTTNANGDSCDTHRNIFLDPMFEDGVASDYHLLDTSRCIGAADPTAPPPTDKDGNPRPNPPGSNPDIGAYENARSSPYTPLVDSLVISISGGNAVLQWPPIGGIATYTIYGNDLPFTSGDSLDTVSDTTWTDVNASSRPSPYFYYVTAVE